MGEQRETFDEVADLYAQVRPGVPAAAVEGLWEALGLRPADAVLEIGCGSGQLTRPLLERGAKVTALEPGTSLAATCETALGGPRLVLERSTFEAWSPGGRRFRAVTACQAAHWIDPVVFLARAAAALEPAGHVGLLWHLDLSAGTEFYKATQPLYDRYLPDVDDKPPRTIPAHVAAYEAAIATDEGWQGTPRQRWPWTRTFTTEAYVGWLRTHSPVRMLDAQDREAFVAGHAELLASFGGEVERQFETVLVAAQRQE